MNKQPNFAVLLQRFFSQRLLQQRQVSTHTVASYRDTFKLLLEFIQRRLHKEPSALELEDIDAPLISEFLDEQEQVRGVKARTRNLRLTAVHSFFRYAAFEMPSHAEHIQRVLAIPAKRFTRTIVPFLNRQEVDALLSAPDQRTWSGRRDHALLLLAVQTGLRLSELTSLRQDDLHFGVGAHVRVIGKGRKERCTPLKNKRVSPHVLRHTTAMELLHAGVDCSVIALWLGHESVETTQVYLDANLALKQEILEKTCPHDGKPGRYQPDDRLLAFLKGL
ncbi:MAG: site-specific integrase [gamma proteobacterium symbiont of Bathyaustriella thionipta]|nr:site-specific integrase [gamma proteobacterium symbiont of Bathyaustriella thionipta]MCU7949427.1 site-specific integrase [gamma proteobacterium symbiont of Bathyaustriella thionipta]MCU7953079.1 site-specific integrase [gamma proteobacterium symbiont of Bathyaustriella thionipta]MCU7956014.1 site-specific integrase [gamma proteobacterium symbiont of Bathyaustriella thionipta]MCU7966242.1 site-specific integrase [gamma proteobacterium symbiont of Bathyaustriella thionipta]